MTTQPAAPDHGSLPGVHISINQVVAGNIRHWRRAAGLTQEELAARCGMSAPSLSAAELSARPEKEKRRFDADALVTFARALGVPLPALLLPPPDDGISARYQFHPGGGDDCAGMGELVSLLISDPSADQTGAMNAYRDRYAITLSRYLDAERAADLAAHIDGMSTPELRKERLDRLAWQRGALASLIGDLDQVIDAIAAEGDAE